MRRFALVLALAAAASGCRSLAHTFERKEIETRRLVSEETLSETWNGRSAVAVEAAPGPDGIEIAATAVETGSKRVRVREMVVIEERCGRRAVAGIFEAPDSFLGVCDDIWVCSAFLAMALAHEGDFGDARVNAVLFLIGIGQMAVDAVCFIPWWIGGHDWHGDCDYVSETRDLGEQTEEREVPTERTVPLSGARVRVFRKEGGDVAGEVTCGADGRARLTLADVVAWSRGNSGDLQLVVSDGPRTDTVHLSPGAILNGPDGTPVDWRAARSTGAPALVPATEIVNGTLVLTVENRGTGDAWQVAAIVASADADADGRVAALGRVRAGERVQVRLALPPGASSGALEFSEAFGRAPAAVPFGN